MALRWQRIYWGAAFANQLDFLLPWHRMTPRENWQGETVEAPSGAIDSWREGKYHELEFEARHVPAATGGGVTGFYGATGVRAFLSSARDGDEFKIRLDRDVATEITCQAVPGTVEESREDAKQQLYRFRMRARSVAGTAFEP